MPTAQINIKPTLQNNIPINWEKSEDVFTGDDLIDAFLEGKEAGKNENHRILLSTLKENINQAAAISENLYKQILSKDIKPVEIHLKAEDITKYKALFVVNKEDFISDKFREVYTLSRRIMNKSESENFYISFSFIPASEFLNEHCLLADGFFMKYEKK